MPRKKDLAIDQASPPFDRYKHIEWLAPERRGRRKAGRGRYDLFSARARQNPVHVLIKVMSRPGLVYERDLENEIASLVTINRELPVSPYFPEIHDHGRLADGRLYLIMSLFDEFPLVTIIGDEPVPGRLVTHLRIAIEIAAALAQIHELGIYHVDLNPMNVLYRGTAGRPIIRIIDFESSYERSRHESGVLYSPPTTPGYSAPEIGRQAPDARSDVFSLGALLYTLVAGYRWTPGVPLLARVEADADLDAALRDALVSAVHPDPSRRFPNVQEFQQALATYLETIWPGRQW